MKKVILIAGLLFLVVAVSGCIDEVVSQEETRIACTSNTPAKIYVLDRLFENGEFVLNLINLSGGTMSDVSITGVSENLSPTAQSITEIAPGEFEITGTYKGDGSYSEEINIAYTDPARFEKDSTILCLGFVEYPIN